MKSLFRFSLRGILVVTSLAAVFIGYQSHHARIERITANSIRDHEGWVAYDFQYDPDGNFCSANTLFAADWLVERFGIEYFTRIESVSGLSDKLSDEHLEKICRLSRLRLVSNNHAWMGSSIGTLITTNDKIDVNNEFDPPRVSKALPISDSGLGSLSKCGSLQSITLASDQITDDGVKHLIALPNLRYLNLASVQITDRSIDHLANMVSLQRVDLSGTWVSRRGVADLRRRLADCKIADRRKFEVPPKQLAPFSLSPSGL